METNKIAVTIDTSKVLTVSVGPGGHATVSVDGIRLVVTEDVGLEVVLNPPGSQLVWNGVGGVMGGGGTGVPGWIGGIGGIGGIGAAFDGNDIESRERSGGAFGPGADVDIRPEE